MKNYPYNTGRTVTIHLDNLGNADIWQLFTILTDGTNNILQGDKPDASPRADTDEATEVFLHMAETADDRTAGYCDAGQRHFFEDVKREYEKIFGDDGPANVSRNEEPANEEPARICKRVEADDEKADQLDNIAICRGFDVSLIAQTNAGGYTTAVDIIGPEEDVNALLRAYERETAGEQDPANEEEHTPATDLTDEGLALYLDMAVQAFFDATGNRNLDAALRANAADTNANPANLYRAGVFAGMVEAAAWQIYATSKVDDIRAIEAAIYQAYGVAL